MYSILYKNNTQSAYRFGILKKYNSNTKLLILSGIICYAVMLSFAPLLHDACYVSVSCYEHVSCHENENERSEQSHSEEGCAACVFINTHIQVETQPKVIISPTFCLRTLPLREVDIWPASSITTIQSRAPPIFSYSI